MIYSYTCWFSVHPVGMGGDYYAFSLPGPSTTTLYFLPLGTTNETISQSHGVHNVSITVRQNNKLETIKQSMKVRYSKQICQQNGKHLIILK